MTQCECPKCGKLGSIIVTNEYEKSDGETVTYWKVRHGKMSDECYLGEGPHDVKVLVDGPPQARFETRTFE